MESSQGQWGARGLQGACLVTALVVVPVHPPAWILGLENWEKTEGDSLAESWEQRALGWWRGKNSHQSSWRQQGTPGAGAPASSFSEKFPVPALGSPHSFELTPASGQCLMRVVWISPGW